MINNTVKFWLYLSLLIPSFFCLLFILYHLLFKRNLRQALNNHVIIVVLIISLISETTIYPWMLYFYQFKGVWRRAFIFFCQIWGYLDWGLYITQTILFAWALVERHILIFHERWVSTKRKSFFVHYLPLILLLLYCLICHVIVYFFPPCKNYYYNSDMQCVDPCLFYDFKFAMWEMAVHQVLPAFIIIIFSIALLARVLWKKHKMHQAVQWRKLRKMTIQVLCISVLYLIFFFPYVVYNLMLTYGVSNRSIRDFAELSELLAFCMTLFLPFVCAMSLPDLQVKLFKFLQLRRTTGRIAPTIGGVAHTLGRTGPTA